MKLRRFCVASLRCLAHLTSKDIGDSEASWFEIMHYPEGGKHTLEAHVDGNFSTIFPIVAPRRGGELVISSNPKARNPKEIEASEPLIIRHQLGRAVSLAAGVDLPHLVRPTIEQRTMVVLNVPARSRPCIPVQTLLGTRLSELTETGR